MIDPDDPKMTFLRSHASFQEGLAVAERLASRWELRRETVLPGATNCIVLACEDGDAREVVLRVPLCDEEAGPGYHAMLAFSGRGGVAVLAYDPATGSILMARARPGTQLSDAGLSSEEEVRACCSVIRLLDSPPIPEAVPVERWYEPFLKLQEAEAIPASLLSQAQRLAEEMLDTAADVKLLHGDLHHFNLLADGQGWVAIDPKGVVGDPCFEPAAFLRNPSGLHEWKGLPELLRTRINTFAEELGLPAYRIWAWGVAQNVLSAWWDAPSSRGPTISIVEALIHAK